MSNSHLFVRSIGKYFILNFGMCNAAHWQKYIFFFNTDTRYIITTTFFFSSSWHFKVKSTHGDTLTSTHKTTQLGIWFMLHWSWHTHCNILFTSNYDLGFKKIFHACYLDDESSSLVRRVFHDYFYIKVILHV